MGLVLCKSQTAFVFAKVLMGANVAFNSVSDFTAAVFSTGQIANDFQVN